MKKGQISILGMISIGLSIIIPTIGGYFYQSRRIDDKIGAVDKEVRIEVKNVDNKVSKDVKNVDDKVGAVEQRTAKLEEAVMRIKEDTAETRRDVKELIKGLNQKNGR